MESEAGTETFAHYIRTDEAGARPVQPDLLERWIANGWLERVVIPESSPLEPVPCVVMDPFMGSGTTAVVARRHGRHALGIELNVEYAELIAERTRQLSLLS